MRLVADSTWGQGEEEEGAGVVGTEAEFVSARGIVQRVGLKLGMGLAYVERVAVSCQPPSPQPPFLVPTTVYKPQFAHSRSTLTSPYPRPPA